VTTAQQHNRRRRLNNVQIVDGNAVPGARSHFFDRIRQRDALTGACYIGEIVNPEWIAFAYEQRKPRRLT
jgi:hypothetical protein